MKIAVVSNAHKPELLNIFIKSFLSKNNRNIYDFYVNEIESYNFEGVIKNTYTNVYDYLSQIDSILQMDYDFVILVENDCFCLRNIEDLLETLSQIEDWQIFGNTQFNSKVHTDTNFEPTEEPDDVYMNFDFAILNPRECSNNNREFAENLISEDEEISYLDRMVLNIINYKKIICANAVCYSLYQNQKDFSNCYVVRFDDLEDHDKLSPTVKFLQSYKDFILENDLPIDPTIMENINYKLSLNSDDTDYLLWYYNLVIGREECQITVSRN